MNNIELLSKILILVPDARCSVHDISNLKNADDGVSSVNYRFNYIVMWNPLNSVPCPSEEELQNVE